MPGHVASDPVVTRRLGDAWDAVRAHDTARAREIVDDLARAHPGLAQAIGGRSGVLWALGERDLARAEALRALTLDPDEGTAHTVLAEVALSARRTKEAVAHLETAYAQAASVRRGRLLVRALREQADLGEAERRLAEVRGRYPDDPGVIREGALLAEAQGRLGDADILWERLLEDPRHGAFARARRMALLARQEDPEHAASQLRRAADLRGRTDPAAGRRLLLEAADAERHEGRYEAAVETYRRYLQERPGDLYAMRQLAFTLRRAGDPVGARPLLEALLRRDPDDAYLRNARVTDALANDPEGGLAFFRALVQEHPGSPTLYAAIRRLEKAQGRPTESRPPGGRTAGSRTAGSRTGRRRGGKDSKRMDAVGPGENVGVGQGDTETPGGAAPSRRTRAGLRTRGGRLREVGPSEGEGPAGEDRP